MNQCVPSWDVDENPISPRTLDYEVAELTWENGQPAMHGLGLPRIPSGLFKSSNVNSGKYNNNSGSGGGGTLESIVNQATTATPHKKSSVSVDDHLVNWFVVPPSAEASAAATMTMDALVPCTNNNNNKNNNNNDNNNNKKASSQVVGGTSTRVGSCSGARNVKLARPELSVSNSLQLTIETSTPGFTSTSNTIDDDLDDYSERGDDETAKMKGTGKGSVSTKRSRAAAIHNQSERKRRDKINQRMKTLQKMIPNSSKTDKASMLDEVIEYLKQLQAQIHMVSRMNLPQMMLPLAMQQQQQQLQMSMMGGSLGMGLPGLGMGMGLMDMNTMGRNNIPGMPPVLHPSAYMQPAMTPWDGSGDRLPSSASPAINDPLTAFLACQSQPMTMDAYTRMAALFQQFQQHPGAPATKN